MLRALHVPVTINIYTLEGIGFVFAIYYAPYVYLFAAAALRNMDPVLEEAAALCGASRLGTMLRVTLPLILPALLSAALLVFVLLIQLFSIPAVLGEASGVHVMSVRIWDLIGFSPPKVNQASALGVLMLAITVTLVILQNRAMAKRSFVTVAGKGLRPTPVALGAWRWPLAAVGFAYLISVVLLPYAALLFIALRKSLFFSSVAAMVEHPAILPRSGRGGRRRSRGAPVADEFPAGGAWARWRSAASSILPSPISCIGRGFPAGAPWS